MRQFLFALSIALALLAAPARGQSLLSTLPDDVLLYWRGGNFLDAIKSIASDTGLMKDPSSVDAFISEGLDEVLAQVSEATGMEVGSMSGYLRSVVQTEFVIYDVQIGQGGIPEINFAIAMETPMAEQIEKTAKTLIEKFQVGFDAGGGVTEIDTPEGPPLMFGRKGDLLVLAQPLERLQTTMSSFGTGAPAKSLASSKRFREVMGKGDGKNGQLYVKLDAVMGIVQREMPPAVRRTSGRVMQGLGVFNLRDLGYSESTTGMEMRITSEGEMPIMDLIAAPVSDAATLRSLPADTVFAYTWNGLPELLWKKGSSLFLDGKRFFFAPFAQEGVKRAQKEIGFSFDELTKHLDLGMTIGFVPDEEGRMNDEGWFLSARVKDEAELLELGRKALGGQAERRGLQFSETKSGLWTEMRIAYPEIKEEEEFERWRRRRDQVPLVSIGEGRIIIAPEGAVKKLRGALDGQYPTLSKGGSLRGLSGDASAYLYVGIGSMFRTFGTPEEEIPLQKGAALAMSLDLSPNEIVIRSRQPGGMILSMLPFAFMTAARGSMEVEVVEGEAVEGEGAKPVIERNPRRPGGRRERTEPAGGRAEPVEPVEPVKPGGGGGR